MTESRLGISHVISTGFLQIREVGYEPLLPQALFGWPCGPRSWQWSESRGRQKVVIWLTYGFCWSLATGLRPLEWIPGAFIRYPKTNTKAFPNTFYKLCDCNSPIKKSRVPRSGGVQAPLLKPQACQDSLAWTSLQQQRATVCASCAARDVGYLRGVQHSCSPLGSHLLRDSGTSTRSLAWAFVPAATGPGCVQPTCISG